MSVVHAFCVSIFHFSSSSSLLCRLCMHTFNFLSLKICIFFCFLSLKFSAKLNLYLLCFFYIFIGNHRPTTDHHRLIFYLFFSTVCVWPILIQFKILCKLCAHAKVDFSSGYSLHLILKVFFFYYLIWVYCFLDGFFRVCVDLKDLLLKVWFLGEKMGSMICMNELCRATTSVEWKKGWGFKSGGFAKLCYNCG